MSTEAVKLLEQIDQKTSAYKTKVEELESDIRELKAQGGRFGSSSGSHPGESLYQELISHTDEFAKLARKEIKTFGFETKAVGDMTFAANASTFGASVATVQPGIIGPAPRPLHIRDLLNKPSMTGSTYHFVREIGGEGGPATVAEGALKPQLDLDFEEATVPAQVIAAWLRVSTQMLDDVPALASYLGNRLLEKLLVTEDGQILNGDGTSPNLTGIQHPGNFTIAATTSTRPVEALIETIEQLAAMGRIANGIILSPEDYFALTLNKASGSGEYNNPPLVSINSSGQITIGGVPVVWTVEQSQGTFLVGDFATGANLMIRSTPRIEFFLQDGTNVQNNKVTVRVEERVALPVYGSDYFAYGVFRQSGFSYV